MVGTGPYPEDSLGWAVICVLTKGVLRLNTIMSPRYKYEVHYGVFRPIPTITAAERAKRLPFVFGSEVMMRVPQLT